MKKDDILVKSRIMYFVMLCLFPLIACSPENKTDATTAPVRPGESNQSTESNPPTRSGETRSFDLGSSVSLEMVWIPGGTFSMGSPSSESGRYDDEGPVHTVELDGFWMGKHKVTQEQYQAMMGNNPSRFQGAKNPVEMVSWEEVMGFCRKLAARTGQPFTLPTEAQWEYACRAGSQTRFHFGDSDSQLGDYAWYSNNSSSTTHPVGQKRPNQFGLSDMHGNVCEWCADWYGLYTSERQKNPTGPVSGSRRVIRGGCWIRYPGDCRSASRSRISPGGPYNYLGFRVCLSPVR